MLHFASENFFRSYFSSQFGVYTTVDLERQDIDYQADLTALSFMDGSYDFVFASHVLEHILDDHCAILEIRRILRPGGIAVLPVPIVAKATIE